MSGADVLAQVVAALKDALHLVDHYAPSGAELGGPFSDATRAKARAALSAAATLAGAAQ